MYTKTIFTFKEYGVNAVVTIFNRKEILVTRDFTALKKCTDDLSAKGIEYKVVTNSLGSPDRYHGLSGIKTENTYEYKVYVNKKAY